MAKKFLDMLYPRHCPLCHGILEDADALLCPGCRKKAVPVSKSRCFRCGRPVDEREEYCSMCRRYPAAFDQGRGIFLYDSMWRRSVTRFKYYGCREYGEFYAKAMYMFASGELGRWKPDMLVPVPLHRSKRRQRGFNQAEYLAQCLQGYTQIPVEAGLVVKTARTKSQKKLNAAKRRQNLKGAFTARRRVDGRRILVIDDVYTTGSTMDAMAQCLKKNGAERVYFLTVCIGRVN